MKPDGFYIIEDLGMSWVDYARVADQDAFMDGELKVNMDRGVPAEQDRSTLDTVFRELQFDLDNRLGAARFMHFWSATVVIQRAGHRERPLATPRLRLPDFLPADRHRALVRRAQDLRTGSAADLGASWNDVETAIWAVSGLAHRELELSPFSPDGVVAHLTVLRGEEVLHAASLGAPGPGARRIDFSYTCSADEGGVEDENAILLFPSDARRDVVRSAQRRDGAVRCVIAGWITGEAR